MPIKSRTTKGSQILNYLEFSEAQEHCQGLHLLMPKKNERLCFRLTSGPSLKKVKRIGRRQLNRVRGLDFLKLQLFVLHNTDTVSFPLSSSRFLRYDKHPQLSLRVLVVFLWSVKQLSAIEEREWQTDSFEGRLPGAYRHQEYIKLKQQT